MVKQEEVVHKNGAWFINTFESDVCDGSIETRFTRVRNVDIWKRVVGSMYKKYVINQNHELVEFIDTIANLAEKGQFISHENYNSMRNRVLKKEAGLFSLDELYEKRDAEEAVRASRRGH